MNFYTISMFHLKNMYLQNLTVYLLFKQYLILSIKM